MLNECNLVLNNVDHCKLASRPFLYLRNVKNELSAQQSISMIHLNVHWRIHPPSVLLDLMSHFKSIKAFSCRPERKIQTFIIILRDM